MRSSNPRSSGRQGRESRAGGNMSGSLPPIDRLDYAVLALEGLIDLVDAPRNLQEVRSKKLSLLVSLVADEIRLCAEELRRKQ